jgi:hypothetical protein
MKTLTSHDTRVEQGLALTGLHRPSGGHIEAFNRNVQDVHIHVCNVYGEGSRRQITRDDSCWGAGFRNDSAIIQG